MVKTIGFNLEAPAASTGLVGTAVPGAGAIRDVEVGRLRPNPANPAGRTREGEALDGLASSMRTLGVLQPLVVCADGDGGFIVLAGSRRLAAARMAGLDRVPVVVREDLSGQADEVMLAENGSRLQLTPLEEAEAIARLADNGLPQTRIGELIGRSQSHVSRRLRLWGLPEEVRRLVAAGKVSPSDAADLADTDESVLLRAAHDLAESKTRPGVVLWSDWVQAAADQLRRENPPTSRTAPARQVRPTPDSDELLERWGLASRPQPALDGPAITAAPDTPAGPGETAAVEPTPAQRKNLALITASAKRRPYAVAVAGELPDDADFVRWVPAWLLATRALEDKTVRKVAGRLGAKGFGKTGMHWRSSSRELRDAARDLWAARVADWEINYSRHLAEGHPVGDDRRYWKALQALGWQPTPAETAWMDRGEWPTANGEAGS